MSLGAATVGPAVGDIARTRDALLVLDLDEVVLHFVAPFRTLLAERGAALRFDSFALHGNVRSLSTGAALTGRELDDATSALYAGQETRQSVAEGVRDALDRLSRTADIVFLTAMKPAFHAARRRLLDEAGLFFPMIATERAKGALVAEMAERWPGPLVFVDDLPQNLRGVRNSVPRAILVHLMLDDELRPHLPPLPQGAFPVRDWTQAEPLLSRLLDGELVSPDAGSA